MAHPRRLGAARALREAHPELDLRIVTDPDPGGPPGALRTARLAWASVGDRATHHLVVQDDMVLAGSFAERVTRAIAEMPDHLLCLFTEWGSRTSHAVRLATGDGSSWVPVLDPYIPTAATVFPAEVARKLAEYEGHDVPDDVLLLRFAREHGLTPLVCVPNLAEHARSESLVGNDVLMGPRRSALFGVGESGAKVWQGCVAPHLLIFGGRSVCHVRDAADGVWREVRTHDHLGLSVGRVLDWFGETVARVDPSGRMRGVVAEPTLLQFWLTALAYGAVAPGPLSDAAWETFAPGTLRRFVPVSYLDSLAGLVAPLIREAVAAAAALPRA